MKINFLLLNLFFIFSSVYADSAAKLSGIHQEISQLQKSTDRDLAQKDNAEAQLKELEISIGNLSEEINHLNEKIRMEQQKLTALNQAQQKILAKLNDQRLQLANQIRAAYKLGKIQPIKVLLNQEDPTSLTRYLTYYRYLNQTQLQLISAMNHTLATLTTNMAARAHQQQQLKIVLQEKQTKQQQQQHAQKKRQQFIATLEHRIETRQQKISVLLGNQKALQEMIAQLQTASSNLDNAPFNQLRGKLIWPLKGTVIASFGSTLDIGEQRLNGVILKTAPETPVHAIYSGKILFADWLRGFGLLVIINHGNGYMSLYARNHSLYAKTGDRVNTGDIIATSGNSGGYSKSGLYFEIRHHGTPMNPALWCR